MPAPTGDLPKTSNPAQRALSAAGITRLAHLTRWTEADVAALHGVGPKVIRILKAALKEAGLSFASRHPQK